MATRRVIGNRCRVRDLGVRLGTYEPGPLGSITDVKGVRVGHATVDFGEGKLIPGKGPARTGVTAVFPHGKDTFKYRYTCGVNVLNGNGIVTATDLMRTWGIMEGPILLTNTLNIGGVYDAAIDWMIREHPDLGITEDTYIPIVGECDDSSLNDIQGRHVKRRHVFKALDNASTELPAEGDVGAGKGMICYEFKGGIGTSSRVIPKKLGGYTVGALVNCNHGAREQFMMCGLPIGRQIHDQIADRALEGSICILLATDAPLNSLQCQNLAARAPLGLARTGAAANHGSGDFVVAWSTTRLVPRAQRRRVNLMPELEDRRISPLYEAAAEAVEEAILNALCMAHTVVGRDGDKAVELPLEKCARILQKHRLIGDDDVARLFHNGAPSSKKRRAGARI